jgi:hypothetical protein
MEKYAWLQGFFSLGMNRESIIMFIFPKIDSQKIWFNIKIHDFDYCNQVGHNNLFNHAWSKCSKQPSHNLRLSTTSIFGELHQL